MNPSSILRVITIAKVEYTHLSLDNRTCEDNMEPCGDLPSDIKPDLSETLQKLEETGNKTGNKQMETLAIPFIDEAVTGTVKDTPVTVKDVVPEKKETKNNESTKTGSAERVRDNFVDTKSRTDFVGNKLLENQFLNSKSRFKRVKIAQKITRGRWSCTDSILIKRNCKM